MSNVDFEIFDGNIHLLEDLFGKSKISSKKNRLREIFEYTESIWEANLDRLSGKKVQNLLIAEAAPWSELGTPRYFYNQIESKYHLRVWSAFFPYTAVPNDKEIAFEMLADKSFLLVDSIPFSMEYSGMRNHSAYSVIINNSLQWWTKKLSKSKISFAEKVNVAFAFKVNGQTVMKALNMQLILKNRHKIELSESLIAADGSGYTNSDVLRLIYLLNH